MIVEIGRGVEDEFRSGVTGYVAYNQIPERVSVEKEDGRHVIGIGVRGTHPTRYEFPKWSVQDFVECLADARKSAVQKLRYNTVPSSEP